MSTLGYTEGPKSVNSGPLATEAFTLNEDTSKFQNEPTSIQNTQRPEVFESNFDADN